MVSVEILSHVSEARHGALNLTFFAFFFGQRTLCSRCLISVYSYSRTNFFEFEHITATSWCRQALGHACDDCAVRPAAGSGDCSPGGARPPGICRPGSLSAVRGHAFGCAGCRGCSRNCFYDGLSSCAGTGVAFGGPAMELHALQSAPSCERLKCLEASRASLCRGDRDSASFTGTLCASQIT